MMDKRELDFICCNLPKLITLTRCSAQLYAELLSNKLLKEEEKEEIDSKKTEVEKASNLYRIAQTKSNGYQLLVSGLERTGQTGATDVLEKLSPESSDNSKNELSQPEKQFAKAPGALHDFLDNSTQNTKLVLVLISPDVDVTLLKIKETVEDSKEIIFENFMKLLPTAPKNTNEVYYVVAKGHREVTRLATKCKNINKKIIILVDEEIKLEEKPSFSEIVQIGHDEMRWDELGYSYQCTLQDELEQHLQMEIEEAVLNEVMHGQVLLDLMKGKCPKLLNDTLPAKTPYYVSRTLRSRRVISQEIFEEITTSGPTHIFLFSGLTRPQLSNLVKTATTENSSKVILWKEVANCRFIVLDNPAHFNRITEKAQEPVHWLSMKKDRALEWVQSSRGIGLLQKFVAAKSHQRLLREEDFFEVLEPGSSAPICIVDSPGMGKTVLLSEIGSEVKRKCPERDVIFLRMATFVSEIHRQRNSNSEMGRTIKEAVKKLACWSDLGKVYLENRLHGEGKEQSGPRVELLLDGLDEVDSEEKALAEEVLKKFQSSFKTVRIWVTSRPHMLHRLEITLKTLGYNILPLFEDDQLNFLTSYWNSESITNLDKVKLGEFAECCLNTLRSKLRASAGQTEIAGIPLQCYLIGEVYKEQAKIYVETPSPPDPFIQLNSIEDLYRSLIETKLKIYREKPGNTTSVISDTDMVRMLQKLSLNLLFKGIAHLHDAEVVTAEVLRMGIVEHISTLEGPRFLHQTFAEYFVALFAAESLINDKEANREFSCVLFEKIFAVTNEFENPSFIWVVPHFMNFMLAEVANQVQVQQRLVEHAEGLLRLRDMQHLLRVSVASSYPNLFKLFSHLSGSLFPSRLGVSFHSELLKISLKIPNLDVFKLTLKNFQIFCPFDIPAQENAIGKVVRKGFYNITEYLLNECNLRSICSNFRYENNISKNRTLLHSCVEYSQNCDKLIVEQKIQIIHTLIGIDPSLLEKADSRKKTPLLGDRVHYHLKMELIKLGANTLHVDYAGSTVLHVPPKIKHLTAEEYLQLLKSIPENHVAELVKRKNKFGSTPLSNTVCKHNPLPETLEMFKKFGADFNGTGSNGMSILALAVSNGLSVGTLQKMMDLGASEQWKGNTERGTGQNLLQLAASYGHENVIEFLVKEKGFQSNETSEEGLTAVDYAKKFENWDAYKTLVKFTRYGDLLGAIRKEDVSQVEEVAKSLNQKEINEMDLGGNSALHFASRKVQSVDAFVEIIKCLVKSGSDVYAKNQEEQTFLHLFLRKGKLSSCQFHHVVELMMEIGQLKLLNVSGGDEELTPFQQAVRLFDVEEGTLSLLHSQGVDLNGVDIDGKNCLADAIYKGRSLELLKRLVGMGVSAKNVHKGGSTLLHYAVYYCKEEFNLSGITNLLLENGASLNGVNNSGESVLMAAVTVGRSLEYLKLLVQLGVDWKLVNERKFTILTLAARAGNLKTLEYFLQLGGVDVNATDSDGLNALYNSAEAGTSFATCFEIVKCLIDNGCDLQVEDHFLQSGRTFLHHILWRKPSPDQFHEIVDYLVEKGHANIFNALSKRDEKTLLQYSVSLVEVKEETIMLLHSKGADLNRVNGKGENILATITARVTGSLKLFLCMMKLGANAKCIHKDGTNLLHYAAARSPWKDAEMIKLTKLLVDNGMSVNSLDCQGESALMAAVTSGRSLDYVKLLVQLGADWKKVNSQNSTILALAAESHTLEVLDYFLHLGGVDVNKGDNDGNTPLHCILRHSFMWQVIEKVKLLLGHGANPNARNKNDETPSDVALKHRHNDSTLDDLKKLLPFPSDQQQQGRCRGSSISKGYSYTDKRNLQK